MSSNLTEEEQREFKNSVFAAQQAAMKAQQGAATPPYQGPVPVSVVDGPLDYDIEVASVPLPSRGLVYEAPSLRNREELSIRGMTADDEGLLMNRSLLKKGTVYTELIKSCVLEKVDASALTSGDRYAILFAIRITTHGPSYQAAVQCPSCEKQSTWTVDLNQMPIKELDLDKVQQVAPFKNEFNFFLPTCKKNITFKFLTSLDEEAIFRELEQKKKVGPMQENPITSILSRMIVSVEGIRDTAQIAKFCKKMPAKDSTLLRKHIEDCEPKIDSNSEFTCEHCDYSERMSVQMGPTFFWPNS